MHDHFRKQLYKGLIVITSLFLVKCINSSSSTSSTNQIDGFQDVLIYDVLFRGFDKQYKNHIKMISSSKEMRLFKDLEGIRSAVDVNDSGTSLVYLKGLSPSNRISSQVAHFGDMHAHEILISRDGKMKTALLRILISFLCRSYFQKTLIS